MGEWSLLELRVEEGCRRLALAHLAAASEARTRLRENRDDPEALHDLRVGLRRLRSVLRAYRPYLEDSVGRKLRRRLRALAAATTEARDAEVHIEWLRARRARLNPRHRSGLDWLVAWLDGRKRSAYAGVRGEIADEFDALQRIFDRRLRVYTTQLFSGDQRPDEMRGVTARLLDEHAGELRARLADVHSVTDEEAAHQARISAKRLRYLLEPLRGAVDGTDAVVTRLKGLQDLLGALHDAAVLSGELRAALEMASGERARDLHEFTMALPGDGDELRRRLRRDPRPGLLALARLIRDGRDELFAALSRDWLVGRAAPFLDQCRELAQRVNSGTPPSLPHEPEARPGAHARPN